MHKSRLGVVVIDCQVDDLDDAIAFWSAALGLPPGEANAPYAELNGPAGEPKVLLQKVDHPSRVHLDIETDDRGLADIASDHVRCRHDRRAHEWVSSDLLAIVCGRGPLSAGGPVNSSSVSESGWATKMTTGVSPIARRSTHPRRDPGGRPGHGTVTLADRQQTIASRRRSNPLSHAGLDCRVAVLFAMTPGAKGCAREFWIPALSPPWRPDHQAIGPR